MPKKFKELGVDLYDNNNIVVYDLTGNDNTLSLCDYENMHNDKSAIWIENNNINNMDDFIGSLRQNDLLQSQETFSNADFGICCVKPRTIEKIIFSEKKEEKKKHNNESCFYVQCSDRLYVKLKPPFMFDCKTKMLYHANRTNKSKIIPTFSIPEEGCFGLFIHDLNKADKNGKTQTYPTKGNIIHTLNYQMIDGMPFMLSYNNKNTNLFDKYETRFLPDKKNKYKTNSYIVSSKPTYALNMKEGYVRDGVSSLTETLFGCSVYPNVTDNVFCSCPLGWTSPEVKSIDQSLTWPEMQEKFNLNTLNNSRSK